MKGIMKNLILVLSVATTLATALRAQVEVLPPDFSLFGKTSGDYCAEYHQYTYPISTNEDYLFPEAGPLSDERVYYLHRPGFPSPTLGIQTYYVPDDVYVYFPVIGQSWDNVEVLTPFTLEQLRDALRANVDDITVVRFNIDGVQLADPFAYRTESPFYTVYFPTADNIYSLILGRPFEGLVDPQISGGYLLMLKPLPPGLHDVHTAYSFRPPNDLTRERHYQIISLPVPQFLGHKTAQLAASVAGSSLAPDRRQPLLATLNPAKASFDSGHLDTGSNQLRAFQNKVRAQVGRSDQLLADDLTQAAQKIIDRATRELQ
jgi:hypothetical protein